MAADVKTANVDRARIFERAAKRERAAREQAERLLETRARELYLVNQALQEQSDKVERRNAEIETAHTALQAAQAQLVQSEKLASVGQLAAGVAHEINNPVGFIKSNLGSLRTYSEVLAKLLSLYRSLAEKAESGESLAQDLTAARQLEADEDIEFILDDMSDLISESLDGTVRVAEIVQGLKSFSRVDDAATSNANIHDGIEATLKVVANELKYKCVINKEFGDLPLVRCNLAKVNQVFMNLLVNAGHAIDESGQITVRTSCDGKNVRIDVEDNGCGIPADKIGSIFDPFFTTKPVGTGTGLGLSISYGIIEEHGGHLSVDSTEGIGTTFTVLLPVHRDGSDD